MRKVYIRLIDIHFLSEHNWIDVLNNKMYCVVLDIKYPCIERYFQDLSRLDISGMQITPGSFSCRHRELQLPKVIIGDRLFSAGVQLNTAIKPDCFYIILPQSNAEVLVNGQRILINQPIVFSQHQEMIFRIPKNYPKYYVVVISSTEFANYYGAENVTRLKTFISNQHFESNYFKHNNSNLEDLCVLIDNLLNRSDYLSYQAVIDAQETLLSLLSELLSFNSVSFLQSNIKQPKQLAIVSRALNFIHTNSALNITIPELASASFCCIRTLEYSFKSILNMTPKQYIIKRRLHLIHSTLKSDKESSIREITTTYGVVNSGRFAQDYFQFFNEYPHQTQNGN